MCVDLWISEQSGQIYWDWMIKPIIKVVLNLLVHVFLVILLLQKNTSLSVPDKMWLTHVAHETSHHSNVKQVIHGNWVTNHAKWDTKCDVKLGNWLGRWWGVCGKWCGVRRKGWELGAEQEARGISTPRSRTLAATLTLPITLNLLWLWPWLDIGMTLTLTLVHHQFSSFPSLVLVTDFTWFVTHLM